MIPKYVLLKEQIGEAISSKKYPLFSKLPTELELTEEYHVSRTTVRQALALLEEDGIIEKVWGSGNTVINSYDSSKKEHVALVLPSQSQILYRDIVADLQTIFYKEQLQLQIFETHNSQTEEREVLYELLNDIYAGYIIVPAVSALPSMNVDLYQKLQKRHLPLLFVGSSPLQPGTVSTVKTDDYECGYMSARYCINKGHNSIAAVFQYNACESFDRFSGYMNACRDSRTPINEDMVLWCSKAQTDFDAFLTSIRGKATALICDTESIAEAVLEYCRENSVSVPSELAVICCSDNFSASAYPIGITALSPIKSVGRELAAAFLATKKDGSVITTTIKNKLIPRESA